MSRPEINESGHDWPVAMADMERFQEARWTDDLKHKIAHRIHDNMLQFYGKVEWHDVCLAVVLKAPHRKWFRLEDGSL